MSNPQRMEIWHATLPMRKDSSVQGGNRPVVIISNDVCNQVSTVVTVAPMTRQMKRLALPTHAVINSPDGGKSVVLLEQIMTIDRKQLISRMGKVQEKDENKIETAIKEQLGMRGEIK